MLFVKYLLLSAGIGMFVIAVGILACDYSRFISHRRFPLYPGAPAPAPSVRWRTPLALVMLAWAPLVISAAIVILPAGMPRLQ
jgi:hypothetical protein